MARGEQWEFNVESYETCVRSDKKACIYIDSQDQQQTPLGRRMTTPAARARHHTAQALHLERLYAADDSEGLYTADDAEGVHVAHSPSIPMWVMSPPPPPLPTSAPEPWHTKPAPLCIQPDCANNGSWECPGGFCNNHCKDADCPRHSVATVCRAARSSKTRIPGKTSTAKYKQYKQSKSKQTVQLPAYIRPADTYQ